MYQNKLPKDMTYEKLYQINDQSIWFLAWVLKQRRCNPGFNQEILSTPFTVQREYRVNGQLDYLQCFKNGTKHGLSRQWDRNGQLWWEREWQNGQWHGLSRKWDRNGQLRWESDWKHGKKIDN